MFVGIGVLTFLVGMSGRESVTPGELALWDRWITQRFGDLATLLGRAPGWTQAGMLVAIAVAVALPVWRAVRRGTAELAAADERRSRDSAVDPICGMSIGIESAAATVSIGEDTFYFCSKACESSFERERDLTSVASE